MTRRIARCMDCRLPYEKFALDVILPRHQWLTIHPQGDGLLCANCIVKRSALVSGSIAAHMVIEFHPQEQRVCASCQHLRSFELTDEVSTCPVVNIRIHAASLDEFGCNLWEGR